MVLVVHTNDQDRAPEYQAVFPKVSPCEERPKRHLSSTTEIQTSRPRSKEVHAIKGSFSIPLGWISSLLGPLTSHPITQSERDVIKAHRSRNIAPQEPLPEPLKAYPKS
jgi:hypothetical protein